MSIRWTGCAAAVRPLQCSGAAAAARHGRAAASWPAAGRAAAAFLYRAAGLRAAAAGPGRGDAAAGRARAAAVSGAHHASTRTGRSAAAAGSPDPGDNAGRRRRRRLCGPACLLPFGGRGGRRVPPAESRHPQLVGALQQRIQRADLGASGTFYRLGVGPLGNKDQASRLCNSLIAAGEKDCLVRRQ